MSEFFDKVGTEDSGPFPLCEKAGCNRRIVPADSELTLALVCACTAPSTPMCWERYVATEEEIARYTEALQRGERIRAHRYELRRKYGRNSKSYDSYEGWCQPKQI